MKATSALVPPTSKLIAFGKPANSAIWLAPMTPDAVPDRRASARRPLLPCSALMTPPFDLVTRAGAGTPASPSAACREPR